MRYLKFNFTTRKNNIRHYVLLFSLICFEYYVINACSHNLYTPVKPAVLML